MIRPVGAYGGDNLSLPRMRGDDPARQAAATEINRFAPHARG